MDLADGSEGWKDREGTKELEKMYQQRHSDVEMIDCRSVELLSPSPLPYSPQALPSAVKSSSNPDTSDQVLAKGSRTSQACSLPLDTIANITDTKHAAINSLIYLSPSCTSQVTPRSTGSDNSSAEQNQVGAFWMSLGWTDGSDLSMPHFGGAPKSAENPPYPSTCSLATPAALRNSPVGAIQDTDDILFTPSTLACLEVRAIYSFSLLYVTMKTKPSWLRLSTNEPNHAYYIVFDFIKSAPFSHKEDHDIFQPNHANSIGILEEFGSNPFPSPFLQRKVGSSEAGQYCLYTV